jgi:hypothetical protein
VARPDAAAAFALESSTTATIEMSFANVFGNARGTG